VRESVIVGLTELTVLGLQQVEDLSEALRQEIDVELWGSTVESRAKFVETKISYLQSPQDNYYFFKIAVGYHLSLKRRLGVSVYS
jgi:hypothetical protein